ncbi:unnamed protein product [Cyclocybe aegerita]|uniref:Uncharacterized protein n=1 Tax=Cyclocybe aegerita TaxID=1973307 RepID=A0A8S0XCY3_CYCAE|nr:unnamed protein product [Cyclocybe aegerita]
MRVFSVLPFYQDATLQILIHVEHTWSIRVTPDLVVRTGTANNFKSSRPGCEGDASLWTSHIERAAGVVIVRTNQDFDSAHEKILLEAAYFARLEFITKGDVDEHAKKHYEEYLAIINQAIAALEQETPEAARPAVVTEVSVRSAIPSQAAPAVVAHILADIKMNSPWGKRKRDARDEQFAEKDKKDNIHGLVKARQVKRTKKAKSAG